MLINHVEIIQIKIKNDKITNQITNGANIAKKLNASHAMYITTHRQLWIALSSDKLYETIRPIKQTSDDILNYLDQRHIRTSHMIKQFCKKIWTLK